MQHETVAIFMTIDDIFSFKSCFITFFFQCLLDVLIMSNYLGFFYTQSTLQGCAQGCSSAQ